MKRLHNSAWRCNRSSMPLSQGIINKALEFSSLILFALFFTSCQKEARSEVAYETVAAANNRMAAGNAVNLYTGLSQKTLWELQQVRAATAKYQHLDNALRDGYTDIAVDVEHMGHHYMKSSIVDSQFDIRQPEILVYNRDENGKAVLVAVEYALPLTEPRPEGFSGSADEWNSDSGFPLWLLHAWVWAYNPDGVFNWTNPTVHLH